MQYMGFISFMILVWDHIITFGDEVCPCSQANRVKADKQRNPLGRVYMERKEGTP